MKDHESAKRVDQKLRLCSWDYNLSVVCRPGVSPGRRTLFQVSLYKNKKGRMSEIRPSVVTRSCSWNYTKTK
jgi:hypothetical protein